jgi:hypothetical protein
MLCDFTSSARFCVVRRLAINQHVYCGEVGALKLEGIAHTKQLHKVTLPVGLSVRIACA